MQTRFKSFEQRIDASIGRERLGYIIMGIIVVAFLVYPILPFSSNYTKTVFISGFFFAVLASSWALLAGIAGQFSFGHMAFMGIGAYTSGLMGQYGFLTIAPEQIPVWVAILLGTLASGIIGLIVGALCLRLKEAYLALFTIAFSELFRIIVLTEFRITGGNNGLRMRRLFDLETITATRNVNYYMMFATLVVALIIMYALANSRVGLFLRAMREDETAASALGVNVVLYKVFVFVITSMIVGFAGGIFYHNVGAERITPESIEVLQMALIIAYAVIGGMESLIAAAAGAFISRWLLEAIREIPYPFGLEIAGSTSFQPGAWRFALFGVVLVMTLRFARNGLLYPIIQWFQGADEAKAQTVAKRNQAGDSDEQEVEGASV